jgi:hypothetical protein
VLAFCLYLSQHLDTTSRPAPENGIVGYARARRPTQPTPTAIVPAREFRETDDEDRGISTG